MNNKIDVLDYGHVELISHMGDDLTVVNSARVSFNKESEWDHPDSHVPCNILSEKDKKLINYLAKHQHWTPFAHPQISLHFKAPIFIRTQLFKHKVGFVENEISRRYVKDKPEFYVPFWRSAPTNGAKQGSSAPMKYTDHITGYYQNICDDAVDLYLHLMEEGVAPEQARSVLPQGTYTEWYWTGSLASYSRVYKQRVDSNAQWEVRVYAETIGKILKELFPVSWEALVAD
jgi:thymidylate synthase (FAD)